MGCAVWLGLTTRSGGPVVTEVEEFRHEVERYTDPERVILADAYQALLCYGPLPHPSSPLVIHRLQDPRAGTPTF